MAADVRYQVMAEARVPLRATAAAVPRREAVHPRTVADRLPTAEDRRMAVDRHTAAAEGTVDMGGKSKR
jgi:hypothetical protein